MRICKKDSNYGTVGFIRAIWKVDEMLECWAVQCDVDAGPLSALSRTNQLDRAPRRRLIVRTGFLAVH